ncbi:MAG: Maf family protein, partial [Muribaculaceae bacterium]|nr:Maf family protein [Muribaculaceae bacterium]
MQPLQNLSKYDIQLASASPRRRQLLEMMGIQFSTNTIEGIDERCPASIPAEDVAAYLSTVKAAAYQANGLSDNDLVITADTIVLCNGKV